MGIFEESVRDIMEELASGDLLEQSVDDLINAVADRFGLWAYGQMVAAREDANLKAKARDTNGFQHCQARAMAFKDVWQRIVFDGRSVEEETLTAAELAEGEVFWENRMREVLQTAIA